MEKKIFFKFFSKGSDEHQFLLQMLKMTIYSLSFADYDVQPAHEMLHNV